MTELADLKKIIAVAASLAVAEIVKVGLKGYIHGWIYVGPKGELGHEFNHPEHGHGKVIEHVTQGGKSHVVVQHAHGVEQYAATFASQKPKLFETGSKQGKTHIANVKVHAKSGRVTNKDDGKTIGTVEHYANPFTGESPGWGWQHEGTFDASPQLYPSKLAATKALIKHNNDYADAHPIGGAALPTHELADWEKELIGHGPDPADVMGPAPLSDAEISGAIADLAAHGPIPVGTAGLTHEKHGPQVKVLEDGKQVGSVLPGINGQYHAYDAHHTKIGSYNSQAEALAVVEQHHLGQHDTASPFKVLKDPGKSGDGYAAPGLWGKYGAAGGMIKHTGAAGTERYLIVQRGPMVSSNKGKWQLPGGALDEKETSEQGFAREIQEELGVSDQKLAALKPVGAHVSTPPNGNGWTYTTHAVESPEMFAVKVDGTETSAAKWATRSELELMHQNGELHPAFADSLDKTLGLFDGEKPPPNMPSLSELAGEKKPSIPEGQVGGHEVGTLAGFSKVSAGLGSNPGGTFISPTGVKYYVKAPKTDDHARNEVLANELYRAAGVNVPEVSLVHLNGEIDGKHGLGVRSKIVDDLHSVNDYGSKDLSAARKDLAVHAWLANHDVVGLSYDNLKFNNDGHPMMVDAGGSLLYRAQGEEKGDKFGNKVGELDTLRDASINPQAAQVYKATTDEELRDGAKRVQAITDDQINKMVKDAGFTGVNELKLRSRLKHRRDDIAERVLGDGKSGSGSGKTDDQLVNAAMAAHYAPGHKPVIGHGGGTVGSVMPVGSQGKFNAYDKNGVLIGVHMDSEQTAVAYVLSKTTPAKPSTAKEPGVFHVGDKVISPHGDAEVVGVHGNDVNVKWQGMYGSETMWHHKDEVSHAIAPSTPASENLGHAGAGPSEHLTAADVNMNGKGEVYEGATGTVVGRLHYNGTSWDAYDTNGNHLGTEPGQMAAIEHVLQHHNAGGTASPASSASSTSKPSGHISPSDVTMHPNGTVTNDHTGATIGELQSGGAAWNVYDHNGNYVTSKESKLDAVDELLTHHNDNLPDVSTGSADAATSTAAPTPSGHIGESSIQFGPKGADGKRPIMVDGNTVASALKHPDGSISVYGNDGKPFAAAESWAEVRQKVVDHVNAGKVVPVASTSASTPSVGASAKPKVPHLLTSDVLVKKDGHVYPKNTAGGGPTIGQVYKDSFGTWRAKNADGTFINGKGEPSIHHTGTPYGTRKAAVQALVTHHNKKNSSDSTVSAATSSTPSTPASTSKPSVVHLAPHPTKPEKENVLLNSNDEKIGSVSTKPDGTFDAHDTQNVTISTHNAKFEATEAVVANHAQIDPSAVTPTNEFAPHALKSTAAYNHPAKIPGGIKGLSPEMKSAIANYTSSGHSGINDYLRFSKIGVDDAGQGGYLPTVAEEKSIMNNVKALDETFKLVPPTTQAIVVKRGVSDAADKMFGNVGASVGSVFKDDGFISTSTDKEFGGDKLEILLPAGAKVLKVGDYGGSYNHSETEFLLPRSSRFKIISDKKIGYYRHTQLELIV